jgi:hypothetical protein
MSDTPRRLAVVVGALALLLPSTVRPQEEGSQRQAPRHSENKPQPASAPGQPVTVARPSHPDNQPKPSLLDAIRVSTEDARRSAAANLAKKDKAGEAAPKSSASAAAGSEDSAVMEFHPADAQTAASASEVAASKKSKRSVLKGVHGGAYGSTAPGSSNHQVGGSAGATSRSGKTSVYVETNQSRADSPR